MVVESDFGFLLVKQGVVADVELSVGRGFVLFVHLQESLASMSLDFFLGLGLNRKCLSNFFFLGKCLFEICALQLKYA